MNKTLNEAIVANFKGNRVRAHKTIRSDSKRYTERRIGKNRTENRWDSVAATDDYTNNVVNIIFNLIPELKGSGAFTGYVRYALTNRWPNRFHFNKKIINNLTKIVNDNNVEVLEQTLSHLVYTKKIDLAEKNKFLNGDNNDRLQILENWKIKKAITNPYYNADSAAEFINAEKNKQLEILKRWSTVTLPTTTPSTFVVRYCIDNSNVNNMISDAQSLHSSVDDNSIDEQIKNGRFERDAIECGITKEDKQLFRNIMAALHDSHRDIRDFTSDEIDECNREWSNIIGDDLYKEEDWSNVNWDEEE